MVESRWRWERLVPDWQHYQAAEGASWRPLAPPDGCVARSDGAASSGGVAEARLAAPQSSGGVAESGAWGEEAGSTGIGSAIQFGFLAHSGASRRIQGHPGASRRRGVEPVVPGASWVR
jgi:hypothetical protein